MASVIFGQVVIGSPGAGKTTYCEAMARFLTAIGRDVAIINIDPANEIVPYKADVDIADLIKLEEVMNFYKLGPNGGLVYCMEYLEKNIEWLISKLTNLKGKYILIDCPGQVELYTHNECVRNILSKLEKSGTRLCAVNLVDAHYCSDPSKYVAVCLTTLNTMLRIELPHVNILSKADLIEKYGKLDFGIDFYTEVLDLEYLIERLPDDPFTAKHKKLTKAITGLVQDYGLVNFVPLSVDSKEQMLNVKNSVDKANGYCFGTKAEERNVQSLMSCAFGTTDFEYSKTSEVREKFMNDQDDRIGNDLDKVDLKDPGFQV
jgi:GTPase SAR1 family protein